MADPFIAEVRLIAFTYAPQNWAYCNGQILSIAQNTAVFSLVGTMYGGNGTINFGLPDLRGRLPISFGQGPGLSSYTQGEMDGQEQHLLAPGELPAHRHGGTLNCNSQTGTATTLAGNVPARPAVNPRFGTQYNTGPADTALNNALLPAGTPGPHENRMPVLTVGYVFCMAGVYPPRS